MSAACSLILFAVGPASLQHYRKVAGKRLASPPFSYWKPEGIPVVLVGSLVGGDRLGHFLFSEHLCAFSDVCVRAFLVHKFVMQNYLHVSANAATTRLSRHSVPKPLHNTPCKYLRWSQSSQWVKLYRLLRYWNY
jgi:hypothetical protein